MSRATIERALGALRDVTGVHGSFVLSASGALLGKDLPAVFHDQVFVEVGERLARLLDAMTAEDDEVGSALLRFADHRLHVTRFPHGLLVVITDHEVNAAALRMALGLAARRLEPDVVAELTSPPPPVGPASSGAPGSIAGSHGAPRTYRGRQLPG
jgi:hypothetical protein